MRVGIVHDYLTQRGGAERVVLSLHRLFPDAPIFTSIYDEYGTYPEFRGLDIRTSFLQRTQKQGRGVRGLLPLYPFAFTKQLRGFDLVISSSSGWAHGVTVPDGIHICYCHAPARWLYQTGRYLAQGSPVPGWTKPALVPILGALRRWDRAAANRPDVYVANSHATAQRIRDTYAREARVVFPPIEVDRVCEPAGPPGVDEPYYLVVSRLLPYKRVDIAMRACQARGARLVIVGAGPSWESLQNLAQPTTLFRPVIPDAELASLFQHCRAVLVCGEEDFGIVPLEANGAGRPVVAYAAGGALETVVDGQTGVLFHDPTVEALSGALDRIEAHDWPADRLIAHATSFGEQRFHREITDVVDDALRDR